MVNTLKPNLSTLHLNEKQSGTRQLEQPRLVRYAELRRHESNYVYADATATAVALASPCGKGHDAYSITFSAERYGGRK